MLYRETLLLRITTNTLTYKEISHWQSHYQIQKNNNKLLFVKDIEFDNKNRRIPQEKKGFEFIKSIHKKFCHPGGKSLNGMLRRNIYKMDLIEIITNRKKMSFALKIKVLAQKKRILETSLAHTKHQILKKLQKILILGIDLFKSLWGCSLKCPMQKKSVTFSNIMNLRNSEPLK
ncbi:hypothetical protein HZS_7794 [Henneguya salminicola]|nr:hypothetical protein HZS_7794 [Henneguya salminicola]